MATIQLHDQQGKVVGSLELPRALEGEVNQALLWQAVRMYLANQRQGTADTKRRGEVRGGGRKPWRQKHTGRARHGTIRSPIWRKGGIVFGPHPRDYRYAVPGRVRRAALVASIRDKVQAQAVSAVEGLEGLPPKTKSLAHLMGAITKGQGALVVVDQPSAILARISRNLPSVCVKPAGDLTCYDVLTHPRLIFTAAGLKRMEGVVQ